MSTGKMNSEEEKVLVQEKIKILFIEKKTNKYMDFFKKYNLVIRPQIIWDLLYLFEYLDDDKQNYVIDSIQHLVDKTPQNSLILVQKTIKKMPNNKSQNILDLLIKLSFQIVDKKPKIASKLLTLISVFYKYNKLDKAQLNSIYSLLSEKFYSNQLNSDFIFHGIKLVQEILIHQSPLYDEPQSFFYFSGLNSGLVIGKEKPAQWPFQNGFSMNIWFYLEEANQHLSQDPKLTDMTGMTAPKLFTLHSKGNGGIEAYFVGNNLYYRNLAINYTQPTSGSNGVLVGEFGPGRWYHLGLEHEKKGILGRSHLNIVINHECKKNISIEFPKLSQVPIDTFTIGENLIGKISSVIFYHTPIPNIKLAEIFTLFNMGIQTDQQIRNLNISFEKALDKIWLMLTPIRTLDDRAVDIFQGHQASILENSGYVARDYTKFSFNALGGVPSILPLFYLLSIIQTERKTKLLGFTENDKNPMLFNELMRLVINLFRNNLENQLEAKRINFFKVVGVLLAEADRNFFNSETVFILAELRNALNDPELSQELFTDIFWKVELYEKADNQVRSELWGYTRTIYIENPLYYNSLFSIKNIIDLMIEKFDVEFKKKALIDIKSDRNSTLTSDYREEEKIMTPLFNIVEAILDQGGEHVADGILALGNSLALKCSPYLHIMIFKLLKKFLIERRDDSMAKSKLYMRILIENKTLQNILYLMNQTNCLDLKAMCIKFLNVILTYPANQFQELDIAQYISKIILIQTQTGDKTEQTEIDELFSKSRPESGVKSLIENPPLAKKKTNIKAKLEIQPIDESEATSTPSLSTIDQVTAPTVASTTIEEKDPFGESTATEEQNQKLNQMSKNLKNSSKKGFAFPTSTKNPKPDFDSNKQAPIEGGEEVVLSRPPSGGFKKKPSLTFSDSENNKPDKHEEKKTEESPVPKPTVEEPKIEQPEPKVEPEKPQEQQEEEVKLEPIMKRGKGPKGGFAFPGDSKDNKPKKGKPSLALAVDDSEEKVEEKLVEKPVEKPKDEKVPSPKNNDEPIISKPPSKPRKGPLKQVFLDTDEVNAEQEVGGEHGVRKLTEQELKKIESEIIELAKQCSEYMKTDHIEPRDFYENRMPIIPQQNPNVPPSVRGNKKIDFGATTKFKPSLDTVGEEPNQSNDLDGTSPEQTQSFIRTTPTNMRKLAQGENILDGITNFPDCEPLYNSVLEWLLHKTPTSLEGTLSIDDTDKINSISAIYVMMKLFHPAREELKERMIKDLWMLAKLNPANCNSLLGVQEFQFFLLDILYHYQMLLYTTELKGTTQSIWEFAIKTHSVLMKHALSTDSEGYKKFNNMLIWYEMKRMQSANKPSPTRYEKGALYLIRHIWNSLMEALYEPSHSTVPPNMTTLWKNIIQMAFITHDLVTSAWNPSILKIINSNNDGYNLTPISGLITIVSPSEDCPNNFNNVIAKNDWIDWKVCETFLRMIDPLWGELLYAQSGINIKDNEAQKLEKKVNNLLDITQSQELNRILEIMWTEVEDPKRGNLMKVINNIVTCFVEDAVKNEHKDAVEFGCSNIEKILKFLIVASENIRERFLRQSTNFLITSNIIYLFKFLYQACIIANDEEVKNIIKSTIKRSIQVLMLTIEYINVRNGNLQNYNDLRSALALQSQKDNQRVNFTLITLDLIQNYFSVKSEPIITIQMIKTLKNKEFGPLDGFIMNNEWVEAFTENEKTKAQLSKFFSESVINVNASTAKSVQDLTTRHLSALGIQDKALDDNHKKSDTELLECALVIYEYENQKRQESLAISEETYRHAKNVWRKQWKKMRTYVGQWRHPDFYDQEDKKFIPDQEEYDKKEEPKYFTHKIAKFETKSRARPYLKVKLIEPAHVIEYNNKIAEKRADIHQMVNSLNASHFLNQTVATTNDFGTISSTTSVNTSNQNKENKDSSGSKFSLFKKLQQLIPSKSPMKENNKIFANKPASIADPSQKEEVYLTKKCQWIKTLTIRNGYLQITSHKLIFILEGLDQKENHIAFLKHSLPEDRKISKEWSLNSLKEIQKRRYILRKTALEIFLMDGSTLLFNFPDGDVEEISQKLIRMRKTRCQSLVYYGSLDSKKILDKSGITKKWMNHEMSNFEYLMQLNALAGRSYKDLTQYPVLPWVICDYIGDVLSIKNPKFFRDLSKSMGAVGSDNRTKLFMERFENNDPFSNVPKFHFGSHYSSPAIILQYLVRLAPFTQGAIQLQSGKFDLPDRLFFSMEESYRGATEELSDVRELIPEFYFLPDFLINREKLDFGKTQTGQRVHNVELPKWGKGNPYNFVALMRQALESDYVSKNIHNWIDLIFGYKQSGKDAEKNLNVFYYMTYEDKIDYNMLNDPDTKVSYESQIVHFGQTPPQIFTKPHPQRLPLDQIMNYKIIADPTADIRVYRPGKKNQGKPNPHQLEERALLKMKIVNESRMIGLRKDGTVSYYKWWSAVTNPEVTTTAPFKCGIEKEKLINFGKTKNDLTDNMDPFIHFYSYPAVFLNMGKILATGGYWDGRLVLYSVDNDQILDTYYQHSDTITYIACDNKENFLITGNFPLNFLKFKGSKSGKCILWQISPENTKLSIKFVFYDHDERINSIFISNDLKLFATASDDGKVNLYNFVIGQLLRTIHHPENFPIETVALSSSPLPAIVFFSPEDRSFHSYSINGRLIESIKEDSAHVMSPIVIKDFNFIELLIYGNEKGEIFFRELPNLNLRRKWDVSHSSPVLSILLSKDRKYLFCGCGDGEFSVLTDPNFSNPVIRSEESGSKQSCSSQKFPGFQLQLT